MKLAFVVLGMGLVVGLSPVAVFAGSYTFVTIDDPLESGVAGSAVTGINDFGHVVGEYTDSSGKEHGYIYANGVFTTVDDPLESDGIGTQLNGINNSGQMVGSFVESNGDWHGFVFDGVNFRSVNDDLGSNVPSVSPYSINDSGQYTGFYHDLDGRVHGFFFDGSSYLTIDNPLGTGSTPSPLDPPGLLGTVALGLNNLGDIVGGYADENNSFHGFIYRNGVYTTIDNPLGEYGTSLFGINDVGQIVGSYVDGSLSKLVGWLT